MRIHPKGTHVRINPARPEALGICDRTGFVFMKKDLIKQFEWRGNALTWTGLLVGRPYLDKPNEQNRPPILPPDPVPVTNPRVQQTQYITWSMGVGIPWNQLGSYPWAQWGTIIDGAYQLPQAQLLTALQNVYRGQ